MLAELMEKLARGEPLDPLDMLELRNQFRAVEEASNLVKSWVQPGTSIPAFQHIEAQTGQFWDVPLQTLTMGRISDQTIPDDTTTPIEFDDSTANTYSLWTDTTSATDTIFIKPGKRYAAIGKVQWETNGTGRRGAHLEVYDQDDSLLYGMTLHSLLPTGSDPDTLPFAIVTGSLTGAEYIKFSVVQTSGGDLDVQDFNVTLFEVMGEKP